MCRELLCSGKASPLDMGAGLGFRFELLCNGKASPLDMSAGGCAATDLDGKEERASLSE